MVPPHLIGEALHIRILEAVVGRIPVEPGSVSVRFLFRLLSMANYLGASQETKAELIRRCSHQLAEAAGSDLVFPSQSSGDAHFYDVDLVQSVIESFGVMWRRQPLGFAEMADATRIIRRVGSLESIPDVGRPEHDDLYKAINIFLKILDGQKLSPAARAHAIRTNDSLYKLWCRSSTSTMRKAPQGEGSRTRCRTSRGRRSEPWEGTKKEGEGGPSSKGWGTTTTTPATPDSSKLEGEFEKKLALEEEVEEAEEVEEEEIMTTGDEHTGQIGGYDGNKQKQNAGKADVVRKKPNDVVPNVRA
ncbi:hypothetical protein MLD38_027725 [Melastoma candidum]|uniref:Uncharacterized protein n=1 Tax=Melastoma candidum TaxID=119954 RepID=A0ACB9P5Q9_9MYRT|nr:hypothetical protein MLD38_027725 [Melastoma candidum]